MLQPELINDSFQEEYLPRMKPQLFRSKWLRFYSFYVLTTYNKLLKERFPLTWVGVTSESKYCLAPIVLLVRTYALVGIII